MTEKMKTTAPVLSVGADGAQPQLKNHNEIIANETAQINLQAAQNPEKSGSGGLQTVSMTELYDTVYPPRTPIVEGFLYGGTYLFVGAPKVGKSFFMGQLAYHVAMGLPLWDYPVRKGTVLYLALEDDYARLQRRLSGMFGVECADNLYFATQAKTLNEGLDKQLEEFLKEHTDARLIIIDTLQKVREVGGDRYSYSSDYEIVTKLKSFSDKYGICLLVVHHTRKLESEDSFDMISGTKDVYKRQAPYNDASKQDTDATQHRHRPLHAPDGPGKAHAPPHRYKDGPHPAHAGDDPQQAENTQHQRLVQVEAAGLPVPRQHGDEQTDPCAVADDICGALIHRSHPFPYAIWHCSTFSPVFQETGRYKFPCNPVKICYNDSILHQ